MPLDVLEEFAKWQSLLKIFLSSGLRIVGTKFAARSECPSCFIVSVLVEPEMCLPFLSTPAYSLMNLKGRWLCM